MLTRILTGPVPRDHGPAHEGLEVVRYGVGCLGEVTAWTCGGKESGKTVSADPARQNANRGSPPVWDYIRLYEYRAMKS
jgi:hypothetical protein